MSLTSKRNFEKWSSVRFRIFNFLLSLLLVHPAFSSESEGISKIKKLALVNGCRIYNYTGNWVKTIPGNFCLFTNDGTVISAEDKFLRRYSKTRDVMWEIPGHFHHQINFSNDKSKILALSSEILKEGDENIRYDKFLIISLEGKVLHELSARDLLVQTKQKSLSLPMNGALKGLLSANIEGTHFNSIYEIPEITTTKVPSYITKDNIIVNSTNLGFYVLTPDLKKVLHSQLLGKTNHSIHDLQVRSNGSLLLFNNRADEGLALNPYFSAIQEFDLDKKRIVFSYSGDEGIFYSPYCGGVQEIDSDLILFSHVLTGAYFYSKSAKKLLVTVPGFTANEQIYYPTQQIKGLNLEDFLRNWEN